MNRKLIAALFALLIVFAFCVPALANSPVPPQLAVFVEDAPEDLELTLFINGSEGPDNVRLVNNIHCFYFSRYDAKTIELRVTTGGRDYTFSVTEEMLSNDATLSFASGEPTLTARPSKTIYSVLTNVVLTLVIEFLVLLLFGYRKGRTFLIFLITNLITQAAYNAFFYLGGSLSDNLYALLAAEILIMIVEGLVYSLSFREHGKPRAWIYSIVANLTSIIVGTVATLVFQSMTRLY